MAEEAKVPLEAKNSIQMFFNCRRCVRETPRGETPGSYARLAAGVTAEGLISVWCVRHHQEVVTISSEDQLERIRAAHCSDPGHKDS